MEGQNESSLCEDPELVLEFLNKDFIKDSLSEYFVPQNPEKGTQSEVDFFSRKKKRTLIFLNQATLNLYQIY